MDAEGIRNAETRGYLDEQNASACGRGILAQPYGFLHSNGKFTTSIQAFVGNSIRHMCLGALEMQNMTCTATKNWSESLTFI